MDHGCEWCEAYIYNMIWYNIIYAYNIYIKKTYTLRVWSHARLPHWNLGSPHATDLYNSQIIPTVALNKCQMVDIQDDLDKRIH